MKKQKRRQFVESITNGMEYTPELEQRIKKEFAGNKDFNFDKIFEVVKLVRYPGKNRIGFIKKL